MTTPPTILARDIRTGDTIAYHGPASRVVHAETIGNRRWVELADGQRHLLHLAIKVERIERAR